jgi:hypothetical protein
MKIAQLVVLLVLVLAFGCDQKPNGDSSTVPVFRSETVADFSKSVGYLVVRNVRSDHEKFRGEVHGTITKDTWELYQVKGPTEEFNIDDAEPISSMSTSLMVNDKNGNLVKQVFIDSDDEYIISEKPIPEIE